MSFYLMGDCFKEKPTVMNTLAVVYYSPQDNYILVDAILSTDRVIHNLRAGVYDIYASDEYKRTRYLLHRFTLDVCRSCDCKDLQGFFSPTSNLRNAMLHL